MIADEISPAATRAAVAASGMRHGDVWSLAGPANAGRRQTLYGALIGRKATRAESGVTAIERRLFEISGVTGSCVAAQASALSAWLVQP